MAASIVTTATTAEQQLFETLTRISKVISDYAVANPTVDLLGLSISTQIDLANKQVVFTVVSPLAQSQDADGGISFDAVEVLA